MFSVESVELTFDYPKDIVKQATSMGGIIDGMVLQSTVDYAD